MYVTKYIGGFTSLKNKKYQVKLKQRITGDSISGGSGHPLGGITYDFDILPITELLMGSDPVIITDPNDNELITKAIHGTEMRMQFVIDTTSVDGQMFLNDFDYNEYRSFLATLVELKDNQRLQGICKIDTFNVTQTSTPAEGKIEITNTGNLYFTPECYVSFTINDFPITGNEPLKLYAVPIGEGINSTNRKLIAETLVYDSDYDDTENVIDRLVAENPTTMVKDASNIIKYSQIEHDEDIDSGWHILCEYMPSNELAISQYTDYSFSGATERQFMELRWRTFNFNGEADSVVIAKHYYTYGETTEDVAIDLKNQINGTQGYTLIENVYFPSEDVTKDVKITATNTGNWLFMYLLEIGELGNGIDIKRDNENATYMQSVISYMADYDFNDWYFDGAEYIGDLFKIQTDNGLGMEDLVSVSAEIDDTAASVIAKLVKAINSILDYNAYINPDNEEELVFYTDNVSLHSGDLYQFITDGESILTPATPTNYDVIEQEDLLWIGYVTSDILSKPIKKGVSKITLSAVCGLGLLKNVTFDNDILFEKQTLLNIINKVLSNTGLTLPIMENVMLYEDNMDTSQSVLIQTYEDTTRINNKNCYDILNEILTLFGVVIRQYKGTWLLLPLGRLKYGFVCNVFINTLHLGYKTFQTSDYIVPITDDNLFITGGKELKKPAFGSVTSKQDYGYVPQLLKFPNFSGIGTYLSENGYNIKYPWRWGLGGISYNSNLGKLYRDDNRTLVIQDNEGQTDTFELVQNFEIYKLNTSGYVYEVVMEYVGTKDVTDASSVIKLELRFGTIGSYTNYLVYDSETETYEIQSGVQYTINITCNENTSTNKFSAKFNYPAFYSVDKIKGQVIIKQPDNGFIKVNFIKINVLKSDAAANILQSYYIDTDDDGVIHRNVFMAEHKELPITLADVPNIPNAKHIYKNALYRKTVDNDFILTGMWNDEFFMDDDSKPLADWVRLLHLNLYAVPPKSYHAKVIGDFSLNSIIKDNGKNYYFILTGGDWFVRNDTVQGVWVQISLSDLDNFPTELQTKQLQLDEQSSGSNSYTTLPGSGGGDTGGDVDLSNYVTYNELQTILNNTAGVTYYEYFDGRNYDSNGMLNRIIYKSYSDSNKEIERRHLYNSNGYPIKTEECNDVQKRFITITRTYDANDTLTGKSFVLGDYNNGNPTWTIII